jgi:hypothetical protein
MAWLEAHGLFSVIRLRLGRARMSTGEATTFAIDRGDRTLAVAENEVRFAVACDARVRPASGSEVQMRNPTLMFARATPGPNGPVFHESADRVITAKP